MGLGEGAYLDIATGKIPIDVTAALNDKFVG